MRNMFAGLMLGVVLAAPVAAQEAGVAALDAALAEAAAVKPGDAKAYVAARARVLALGEGALAALAERGAEARFQGDGWRAALVAEACRVRLTNPLAAQQVDAPRGIDPASYRKYRRPEPFCHADLAKLGREGVPLLLERFLWTLDARPYSEGNAGKLERQALGLATLAVPGQVADARARLALEGALRDAALPADWRQAAAVSLGQVAGAPALPTLLSHLDDATQPPEVREGCAWALGRVPSAEALAALTSRLDVAGDGRMVRALVNGLGLLGDAWVWEARGATLRETAPAIRERCAQALVAALEAHPAAKDQVGAALQQVLWPASGDAVRALAAKKEASKEARDAALSILPALEVSLSRVK